VTVIVIGFFIFDGPVEAVRHSARFFVIFGIVLLLSLFGVGIITGRLLVGIGLLLLGLVGITTVRGLLLLLLLLLVRIPGRSVDQRHQHENCEELHFS